MSIKWRNHSLGQFYDAGERTVVYFDSRSGDTHLLSNFAAYVIQQIDDQSVTTENLVTQIAPIIESDDISQLMEAVSGLLKDLVALDILKQE